MWVHGLRRFGGEDPHRLRLDSKLVCIIGANEVGKSTLLNALVMSQQEARDAETDDVLPVDRLMFTRGEAVPSDRDVIRVRYRLVEEDFRALADQPSARQLGDLRWVERTLAPDGRITTAFAPAPQRDKTLRWASAKALRDAIGSDHWPPDDDLIDSPADPNALSVALEALGGSGYYLGPRTVNTLSALADWIEEAESELDEWRGASTAHRKLPELIREMLQAEAVAHPIDQAREVLLPRIPRFIQFHKDERGIGDEYDLADPNLPDALLNLAELAGLDLELLRSKVVDAETGTVEDLRDAANAELARRFGAWSQKPPVRVSFGLSGTRLFVHVKSGSGPSMRLGERSDGLRQFVALVAMTAQQQHRVPPILLIDEVEMHLHYDAQADLIGVLAEQTTAAQVITPPIPQLVYRRIWVLACESWKASAT